MKELTPGSGLQSLIGQNIERRQKLPIKIEKAGIA